MGENMCKWSAWQGIESESEVAQSYLTLSNPMDCSPPGFSVYGIFQARVLEWVAIAFSKRKHPREWLKSLDPSSFFSNTPLSHCWASHSWSQGWLWHWVITSTLQAKLGMWTLSPRKSAEEIVYNCTCFYSKENQRPSNEKQERMILA